MGTEEGKFCVAVVDDDASVRVATARLLRASGYVVESHASGIDLLRSLEGSVPNCIVLDLNMPDLNGFDIQRLLNDRDIPIILVTGAYDKNIESHALALGAIACFGKPTDASQLLATIGRLQPEQRHRRSG